MPNKWSIVGGVIEEGEVPIEAMIRECEEEIGLEPSNVSYDHKIMTTDSGEIYYFVGTLESTDIKLDYENSAYKFISKDEIDNYDFVPYIKEFILSIFSRNTNKSNNHFADGGSVLLAPNGKKSNLTALQYKLVRTKAFKDWFGDWENNPESASKVVDSNGEPLPVYHGTNAEPFVVFYEGSFFTDDYMNADGYASGEMVYEVFLNIKKPLRINARGRKWDNLKNKYGNSTRDIVGQLDMDIYDGVIFNNINDNWFDDEMGDTQNVYFSINPEQIKLANGSNTTFDSNNPDIRYAGGGNINDDDIRVFEELYHGTSKIRSDEIISNGFSLSNQGEKSGLGSVNGISLTSDFDIAQEHSDWASEKFNDEGSVLIIKSETLKILSGSKFASLNSDFEKAFKLYEKGLIDGIELCDYETGDGCEEFEVFIFNTNKLNNLIIK